MKKIIVKILRGLLAAVLMIIIPLTIAILMKLALYFCPVITTVILFILLLCAGYYFANEI